MLKFIYGTMGSGKTALCLMQYHNLSKQGRDIILLKPAADTRSGETVVASRIGLSQNAIVVRPDSDLRKICRDHKNIIVDEAQFLSEEHVQDLRILADNDKNVFCYGLKTDFKTRLFEGSRRLIELADEVEDVSSVCKCGKKAVVNARLKDGKIVLDGEQILIGGEEYEPMCFSCAKEKAQQANASFETEDTPIR